MPLQVALFLMINLSRLRTATPQTSNFLNWAFPGLFLHLCSSFLQSVNSKEWLLKVAGDWIRTWVLWYPNRRVANCATTTARCLILSEKVPPASRRFHWRFYTEWRLGIQLNALKRFSQIRYWNVGSGALGRIVCWSKQKCGLSEGFFDFFKKMGQPWPFFHLFSFVFYVMQINCIGAMPRHSVDSYLTRWLKSNIKDLL